MSLLELCAVVFTYNAMTFGNGPGMVPLLQADLVDRRGVLTSEQLLYAFTIAGHPGQANTYVAAIGYMLHGLAEALATTAAIQLPGYLMLPLLWGYQRLGAVKLVPAFTRGLTVASVGAIFAATVPEHRPEHPNGWVSLAVFAAALAMAQLLKWNPLVVLAVSTLLGTGAWVLGWV